MKKTYLFLMLLLTLTGNSFGCQGRRYYDDACNRTQKENMETGEPPIYNFVTAAILYHGHKPEQHPKPYVTPHASSSENVSLAVSTGNSRLKSEVSRVRAATAVLVSSQPLSINGTNQQATLLEAGSPLTPQSLSSRLSISPLSIGSNCDSTTSGVRSPIGPDESQLLALLSAAATKLGYAIRDEKELADHLKTQLYRPSSRDTADTDPARASISPADN